MQTAIQLHTLRHVDESTPALLDRVGDTALDGVEFADAPGGDVQGALADAGLSAAAAHVDIEALEADVQSVAATCDAAGCNTVVVPYLDESDFESERAVEATASRLTAAGDALADRGLRLAYHNHDHEFTDLGDGTAFDLLVEKLGDTVAVELDLGWALAAGQDPAALLSRLGTVPLVHLKDVDAATGTPVALGEGDLDVDGCVAAARDAGVEWLVYEHDDPADPLSALSRGAGTLADFR
ncbi:sugar phosphate isomerase/epimerase family protein [Halostella litorea]|uniref:sugar phosphate isomerase/epimerase family protein n=1 Tax=Halostella litorea TaxID=2528831 RepID=UPI0010925D19|nr:sugar phosphate isomerase/epimerase [Halostella litorea]